LIEGGGGVFEITVDGELRFSKKALGRFPTDAELDAIVQDPARR
jgi:selT/selW/selH-like putative selenoprotein